MKKENHHVSFTAENYRKAEEHYQDYNFRSVSELIDQALEFYLSYRAANKAEIYLTEALSRTLQSTVQTMDERIEKVLYKIAVEDAMIKEILADEARISPSQVQALRQYCVEEVKALNGILNLKRAAEREEQQTEDFEE